MLRPGSLLFSTFTLSRFWWGLQKQSKYATDFKCTSLVALKIETECSSETLVSTCNRGWIEITPTNHLLNIMTYLMNGLDRGKTNDFQRTYSENRRAHYDSGMAANQRSILVWPWHICRASLKNKCRPTANNLSDQTIPVQLGIITQILFGMHPSTITDNFTKLETCVSKTANCTNYRRHWVYKTGLDINLEDDKGTFLLHKWMYVWYYKRVLQNSNMNYSDQYKESK